jgi:asparagine synthase (glutamine-hydrolysing)
MCGISGMVVPPGQTPSRAILKRINDTLARRGPDDEGYYLDVEGGCGLGHRRLSIIDLSGGHQPLTNTDGSVQIVCNGEIYNFKSIRAELEAAGYRFRTNSDCEVIAHGYEKWGEAIIAKLGGMFALAIWDAKRRRLVLARDRMGKKPMYYGLVGGALVFGSELKAIAAHPEFSREVSLQGLASYLTYECVPEGSSIYRGVEKLLPGNYLVFDREPGRVEVHEYWRMRFASSPWAEQVRGKTEEELALELRRLIRSSTEARLIADVPLGVFLSGGIDSSVVTAAMADVVPRDQIKTFSVTFEDKTFDESTHARKVAQHLGTDHHEERLSPQVLLDVLPEISDFMCEPLGDGSLIPTYLLARFTRRTVKVALGGDGGDELFLGYPTFQADLVADGLERAFGRGMPMIAKTARAIAKRIPVSRRNFSFDFKAKRFASGLGMARDFRHQAWMGSFMPDELSRVLDAGVRSAALETAPYDTIASFGALTDARDHFDRAVFQYGRLYLTGDVLVKVDRASMANGLEVRAPLLDTDVVEFAAALPGTLKLKGLTTKYLLKKAARGWIPDEIIDRPKKGFGMPIAEWIRDPLNDMAHDLLSQPRLRREGFFDPLEVARLLDEHERGIADHRKPLWTLLAFELWMDRYGPSSKPAALRPEDDSAVVSRRVG